MAIANSYPMGTPKSGDLLLGTSVPTPNTNEKATTRNSGVEAVAALVNRGYIEVTKVLTNAEWIALPTTAIAVVPAVASKHIQVLSAYATFTSVASDYFYFTSDLILTNRTSSPNLNSAQIQARIPQNLEGADDTVQTIFELEACQPSLLALYFSTLSTATNSGGGTVSITVRYTLI